MAVGMSNPAQMQAMGQQAPWENPSNYKKCVKKQYEIWVCKPPVGTVVINKLEQADAVKIAGGHTFFLARDIKSNPKIAVGVSKLLEAGKAYLVKDNQTFVLCGTQGELWCINAQKLGKKYVWASDGSAINGQTFKSRAQTCPNSINGTTSVLDWTKVRTVPDNSTAFACFVPAKIRGQIQTSWAILNINGVGVPHGKGDFVISQPDANGNPSADRYVVNGAVFADTYDNRGWQDCLSLSKSTGTSVNLPNLFGFSLTGQACGSSDFNKQAVFEQFSKAAKILDSNGYVAHEVDIVSSRRELAAELLHSRLKTDTFACLQIPNSFDIYVLFSDMTVFSVEHRNVAAPYGGVSTPWVLKSTSAVKSFFNRLKINEILQSQVKKA